MEKVRLIKNYPGYVKTTYMFFVAYGKGFLMKIILVNILGNKCKESSEKNRYCHKIHVIVKLEQVNI